jgi:2-polyprenyl-6-methoxyphenol hydroxylase-like FAD-dependent oxidoreductase
VTPEVVVVGAGPTGLLLAGELERRDISCLLIDAHDAPQGWDRATVVHARSMEAFEAVGVVDRFLEQGVRTRAAHFFSDGEMLGELDFTSASSRYPFDVGISEEVTEAALADNLERHGGSVTRSTRLVGFEQSSDSVTVRLERDGEESEVTTSWLVGCDGLHSAIREQQGIDFEGSTIEAPWAVFDATLEDWQREYDVVQAHLDVPPVILTPLPGERWRVYLRPSADDGDLIADAEPVVQRYAPDATFAAVENPARFHCHSRVASRFRSGRVFLAGDAAHVCSPAEGHGMNTGLQDAFNLGWKLALACRGQGGEALLDSYEAERRPVAERVVQSGADTESGHAMTDSGERAARDSDIRALFGDPDSAHHEAVAAAELDRSYAGSAIVLGGGGTRLPDTDPPLHELTHRPGHTVLVLGGPKADAQRVQELSAELESDLADSPVIEAVVGLPLSSAVAEQLGVDGVTVLAVRPDRYVGLRDDNEDAGAVRSYVEALTA